MVNKGAIKLSTYVPELQSLKQENATVSDQGSLTPLQIKDLPYMMIPTFLFLQYLNCTFGFLIKVNSQLIKSQ